VRRPLVLVVDDTPDNREMYIEYLEYVGFNVVGATDGESAVETARKLHPSLVLMDVSLPGLDGLAATRILKTDPRTRDILVVALTGHAGPAMREEAERAGCDSFLAKPCLPRDIAKHLLDLLDAAAGAKPKTRS
jgi:CheY-like chemotaxis protein